MVKLDFRSLDTPNFRLRVISALVMAPVALYAVSGGGFLFTVMVIGIALMGLREWLRLVDAHMLKPVADLTAVVVLATLLLGAWVSPLVGLVIGVLGTAAVYAFSTYRRQPFQRWIALGVPYMAVTGLALFYLRAQVNGDGLIYYLLAVVWGCDIGAYLSGRLIGGAKLAPVISPNKTWAGLFGGMALAAICGYAVATGFNAQRAAVGVGLALVMAAVSQLGDLFESYFKRRSGVKESSGLIPGHGGVLDRIDSLVFASMFFVIFQIALGAHMRWW